MTMGMSALGSNSDRTANHPFTNNTASRRSGSYCVYIPDVQSSYRFRRILRAHRSPASGWVKMIDLFSSRALVIA